jgi:hypothetical protein
MLRIVCIAAFTIILTGCASVIEPSALSKVENGKSITLVKNLSYHPGGIAMPAARHGAIAGNYIAEWSSKDGTYYRGPGLCIVHGPLLQQGGIWIPHSATNEKFRLYSYIGSHAGAGSGSGVEAMVEPGVVAAPTASPVQAGLGVGVAVGIGMAIEALDAGKIALFPTPPNGVDFDSVLAKK